jgi:hypothetical protein
VDLRQSLFGCFGLAYSLWWSNACMHVGPAKSKSVSDPGCHVSPDSGCRQEHHSCGCIHKCCHRRCVFVCGALLGESFDHAHLISLSDCIAHCTASCANEVLKLASGYVLRVKLCVCACPQDLRCNCSNLTISYIRCCANLNNYMVFNDAEGLYTYTFEYERKV